jgi:hypothetical protein
MHKKEDKIFNNRYNTGDVNYEVFGKIQVHEKFLPKDVFDEYTNNSLQEDLYVIFLEADFYEEYSKSKKVVRGDVSRIYYYFDDNLKASSDISSIEKFIAVADFMSISYDVLYEELAPVYKEALLRELDEKYKIFKKRGIKRLF